MNVIYLKTVPLKETLLKRLGQSSSERALNIITKNDTIVEITVTGVVNQDASGNSFSAQVKLNLNSLGGDAVLSYLFLHNDNIASLECVDAEIFVSQKDRVRVLIIN